jgi:hypothetical protein
MRRRQSADVPQALCLARREIEQWRQRQSGRNPWSWAQDADSGWSRDEI